jgi:hypothetical protein
MNKHTLTILSLILLITCANNAFGQNAAQGANEGSAINPNTAKQENTKPLELPAFIIEGTETINLRSGTKQNPKRSDVLKSAELDSLNTFEKQAPTLLQPTELPSHYVTRTYGTGFVRASYGLFNTPEISAGYKLWLDRFDIFANAGAAFSNGDAPHSENNKLYLNIASSYVAEDKWLIFGGSHTRTDLFINTQNYNLYGVWNEPKTNLFGEKIGNYDRNVTQAKFNVVSDGVWESVQFSVGGTANYITVGTDDAASKYALTSDMNNYYARGFLKVKNYWNHFLIGLNADLNFESALGNSLNYYEIGATASYFNNKFSLLLDAGFQVCNNSADISRGGLQLHGNLEYRISDLFTFKASGSSGIARTDFEDILAINPYISNRLLIDHRYDLANISGSLWYHPTEKVMLSAGVDWRYSERNVNFIYDTLSEFSVEYIDGIIFDMFVEGLWNITETDKLNGRIQLNMSDMKDDKHLTYMPLFKFSGTYHKTLFEKLGMFVTLELTGSRNINTTANVDLSPYFLLDIGADYTIGKFNIFIKINNLTNTKYYVWDGYMERRFFGKAGLMWIF